MLNQFRNRNSFANDKDLSLFQINAIRKVIDSDNQATVHVSKEIKNEVYLAKQLKKQVDKSFSRINTQANDLAARYEEEKNKNEKLEQLVKSIEQDIFQAKLDKYKDVKNKVETDKFEEQTALLQNREKQLEKVIEKANNSSYQISKKVDSIRALRSERTIFSTLFDKIERELCNLDHCYKILLIQRKICEHQYAEEIAQFNKIEQSANRELQRIMANAFQQKEHPNSKNQSLLLTINENEDYYREEGHQSVNSKFTHSKQKRLDQSQYNKHLKTKPDEMIKIEKERAIKVFLNEMCISDMSDFPNNIDSLEKGNQQLLDTANQIYDQIKNLEIDMETTALKYRYHNLQASNKLQPVNAKLVKLNKINKEIKQIQEQIHSFQKSTKQLFVSQSKQNKVEQTQFATTYDSLKHYLQQLQIECHKLYPISQQPHQKSRKHDLKKLSLLLNANNHQKTNMIIYEEEELLQIAKKSLQKLKHKQSHQYHEA